MENQNFIRPVTHEKRKRFLIVGIIGILVIGGTLAVWITRQQTQQRSKAAPSTTISFNPSSQTVGVNQTVNADIILNPGQNQISVLKLVMTYDANKFDKTNASLTPILASPDLDSQGFVQILESPVTDACTGTTCKMSVTLSIGTSPTKVITKPLKIATISLKAKEATDGSPAAITIDSLSTAFSIGGSDQANENVIQFSSLAPLLITIGTTPVTPVPTGACVPDQSTCQWDSVSGVANYHYKVTDVTTGTVIQESDVDGAKTSVQFPSLPGKTYKCSVTATNACAATSKAGEATQTCQVITPTPTPAITVTPTPTLTGCPTPGTVKNLRMTCPNCPAQ